MADGPVTAAGECGCAKVTVIAPPGTDPALALGMAQGLAANAHLLLGLPPAPGDGGDDG